MPNYLHLAKIWSFCRHAVAIFEYLALSYRANAHHLFSYLRLGDPKLSHARELFPAVILFLCSCSSHLSVAGDDRHNFSVGTAHLFSGWQLSLISWDFSWANRRRRPYFQWLLVWGRHLVVFKSGYLETAYLVWLQCSLNCGRAVGFSTGLLMEKKSTKWGRL